MNRSRSFAPFATGVALMLLAGVVSGACDSGSNRGSPSAVSPLAATTVQNASAAPMRTDLARCLQGDQAARGAMSRSAEPADELRHGFVELGGALERRFLGSWRSVWWL